MSKLRKVDAESAARASVENSAEVLRKYQDLIQTPASQQQQQRGRGQGAESGAHAPEQPVHGDAVVIAVKAGINNKLGNKYP